MQDSYAAALSPIGIERGIKGSHATYTKIKEYYWYVNQESPELDCFRSLPEPRSTESAIGYKQRVELLLQPSVDVIDRQLSDRTLPIDFLSTVPQVVLVDNNNPNNRQLVQEIQKLLPQATRIKSKSTKQNQHHLRGSKESDRTLE